MRFVSGDNRVYAPMSLIEFSSKLSERLERFLSLASGANRYYAPMSPILLFYRLREMFVRFMRLLANGESRD